MKWITLSAVASLVLAGLTGCGPEAPEETLTTVEATELLSLFASSQALNGESTGATNTNSGSTNGSTSVGGPAKNPLSLPQDPIPCVIVRTPGSPNNPQPSNNDDKP